MIRLRNRRHVPGPPTSRGPQFDNWPKIEQGPIKIGANIRREGPRLELLSTLWSTVRLFLVCCLNIMTSLGALVIILPWAPRIISAILRGRMENEWKIALQFLPCSSCHSTHNAIYTIENMYESIRQNLCMSKHVIQ